MEWNMRQHTVKLREHAPHHDLLEMAMQVLILTVVMVAQYKTLASTQSRKDRDASIASYVDIAQMIDDVLIVDYIVPLCNHVFVHVVGVLPLRTHTGSRGAVSEPEHVGMPEMCVRDYEYVTHFIILAQLQ